MFYFKQMIFIGLNNYEASRVNLLTSVCNYCQVITVYWHNLESFPIFNSYWKEKRELWMKYILHIATYVKTFFAQSLYHENGTSKWARVCWGMCRRKVQDAFSKVLTHSLVLTISFFTITKLKIIHDGYLKLKIDYEKRHRIKVVQLKLC